MNKADKFNWGRTPVLAQDLIESDNQEIDTNRSDTVRLTRDLLLVNTDDNPKIVRQDITTEEIEENNKNMNKINLNFKPK